MQNNSFYSTQELSKLGLKVFGENILISRKASFYSPNKISIGNNVRIDDFCILSGEITIGSNIHIGAFCSLYGSKGIELKDFSGLSPRTTIFSASDDFGGDYLISPMSPQNSTNITGGKVILNKFVQIGAGCIIMPNLSIGIGSVLGSMSFLKTSTDEWGIYFGVPAKFIRSRSKGLLELVK